MRHRAVLLLLLVATLVPGCGATVRSAATEAPRIAVPIAIDETVKSLEDVAMRERIARVVATPEVQRMVRDVAASAVSGVLGGASSEVESERFARLVAQMTVVVSQAVAHLLRDEVASRPEDIRDAKRAFEAVVSEAVSHATRAELRTAAEEIPQTLGPAVGKSLATELESPALRKALASTVAEVMSQAVAQTQANTKAAGMPTLADRLGRVRELAWAFTIALGACAVALLAWGLRIRRRTKRFQAAVVRVLSSPEGIADPANRALLEALAT
jgi:hypothetical protein